MDDRIISFSAKINKIGINPYVLLPATVLKEILAIAKKQKGHVPILLLINNYQFKQTLVRYSGKWRLYINGSMLKTAGKKTGDTIELQIAFDAAPRMEPLNKGLQNAIKKNKEAAAIFNKMPAHLKKEMHRYINNLKTQEAVDRNIKKALAFLLGKERFIGRDNP